MATLSALAGKFGLELSPDQIEAFSLYKEAILSWNERVNLTRIPEAEIEVLHFLDSIIALKYFSVPSKSSLVDVGTGAGLPGIPLKILKPEISLSLIEARDKKIFFLEQVAAQLKLNDISIIHGRAEELSHKSECREVFDLGVARAFSSLANLVELVGPFIKVGGHVLAWKGKEVLSEIEIATNALNKIGLLIEEQHSYELPEGHGTRELLVLKKTGATPEIYPRSHAAIKRKSL